jgi:hypothetical protein
MIAAAVRAVGIEPTLLAEPDFERPQMVYPISIRQASRPYNRLIFIVFFHRITLHIDFAPGETLETEGRSHRSARCLCPGL